ncbi:MAG: AbrB/MazE/SpoVT family DNA-binding domain-containing protein [Anaerolineae bacterium]|nr:AbrB/MazE/SpoVT family DNA-binding domain-containing protein [Anaerolineae bacterium]
MRVTTKGQVTIPLEIRQKLNITPTSEVDFVISEDDRVYLVKKSVSETEGHFTRLRGIATVKMSTEEIMALTRAES